MQVTNPITTLCPTCGENVVGLVCAKDGTRVRGGHEFQAGAVLGKYLLEQQIGEGGMGVVWRARNPDLHKRVAIKILNPELANTSAAIRFKREALAVNEIRHKNLVDIFDIGELPDGRPYFVMEHLEGESLDDRLRRVGPLPFAEILQIITPVCRAVYACHQKGIIHRDLKPENIFLVKEEDAPPTIKILDFGIAKVSHEHRRDEEELTSAGSAIGTPEYMSPEQCESTKDVDHRSDIYALGVILFEMIAGVTPFHDPEENMGLMIVKQLTMPAPSISSMTKRALPAELDAVLLKSLEKDPSKRQQNSLDLLKEFTAATVTVQQETAIPKAEPPPAPPPPKKLPTNEAPSQPGDFYTGTNNATPSRRGLVWVGAALSIVVGSGVGLLLFPSQPPAPTSAPVVAKSQPVEPKKVQASISSNPKGASVFLGDTLLGQTPLEVELLASDQEQTLRFSAEGFEDTSVTIKPNTDLVLSRNLQAAQSLPASAPVVEEPKTPAIKKTPVIKKPKDKDPDIFIFDPTKKP